MTAFESLLRRAVQTYPLREDNEFHPAPPPPLIGVPREIKENFRVLTVAMELVFAPNRVELRQSAASRELNGTLVTDAGGVLSHTTIAPEYGIAAVLATGNATELIRDGDAVKVDGVHGVVEILG